MATQQRIARPSLSARMRLRCEFYGRVADAYAQIEYARELRRAGDQKLADFVMKAAPHSRRHAADLASAAA